MTTPALAVAIRAKTRLSIDEVEKIAVERAPEFRKFEGLIQKYYLHDEKTDEIVGFYLWRSAKDLGEFQESELRATIAKAYQVEGDPRIEVFRVMMTLRD